MPALGRLKPQGHCAQAEGPKNPPVGSKQPPCQRQLPQDRQGTAILPTGLGRSDFVQGTGELAKAPNTSLSLPQKRPSASAARGGGQHRGGWAARASAPGPQLTLAPLLQGDKGREMRGQGLRERGQAKGSPPHPPTCFSNKILNTTDDLGLNCTKLGGF